MTLRIAIEKCRISLQKLCAMGTAELMFGKDADLKRAQIPLSHDTIAD
jgi:hypothetical protein